VFPVDSAEDRGDVLGVDAVEMQMNLARRRGRRGLGCRPVWYSPRHEPGDGA
jgi:hypothetical protein